MKLSLSTFLLLAATLPSGQAYLTSPSRLAQRTPTFMRSSASTESDFSAFADSLEEEPEQIAERPWQAKFEDLLDPQTNSADRQILLSELLGSNDEIRESVLDALANRNIDPLVGPTGKKLREGVRAVVRQVANDILPELSKGPKSFPSSPLPSSPPSLEKVGSQFFNLVSNQIQKNFEDLQEDLSDPINKIPQRLQRQREERQRQREEILQELRNAFLETPEGLQGPSYTVVESCDLYEVRDYEGYTVASTAMDAGEDLASAGTAFNTLASYLFGANKESKSMAMTMPVATTNLGEMRFFLAESSIPEPNSDSSVDIVEVPAARLAVRAFTGFATDGEVARQKDTLLQALEMDGVELDVAHGAVVPYAVLQYNSPFTLPFVRRNELVFSIKRPEDYEGATSLKKEWNAGTDDDGVSSWTSSEEESESSETHYGQDDVSPSDY